MAQKEKERKEENLKKMAQQAREERAGIRTGTNLSHPLFLYISTHESARNKVAKNNRFYFELGLGLLLTMPIPVKYS